MHFSNLEFNIKIHNLIGYFALNHVSVDCEYENTQRWHKSAVLLNSHTHFKII